MNFIDTLISEFDRGLRTVVAPASGSRPLPRSEPDEAESPLSPQEKLESARMMRVNHTGEVCAQALYQGQALVVRSPIIREVLVKAAQEERDHLAWCEKRITDLGGSRSLLNPLWYAGSYGLGVASGLLGDRWSMGFLVETERQVEHHLDGHLQKLPAADITSRQIVDAMRMDEIEHGNAGAAHGAAPLPALVKGAMRATAKVMTRTAYWI